MLLHERIEFTPADVLANTDYCKAGYGVLTESEREAIHLFAKYEGLLLDPVYTGRAAAGMIDLIRKEFFTKDETVLFLHTGGQPALFADQYANKILIRDLEKFDQRVSRFFRSLLEDPMTSVR